MLKKLRKTALLLPIFLAIAGCSEKYSPRESIVDDQKAAAKLAVKAPQSVLERQAYEKGVQDVLVDMKGKMRARDRFTWDAPMVQCGVQIPARTVNGMLIPAHEECVQIAPGRWTEEAPTFLPVLGASND
jgi:hypothetical protein